MSTIKLENIQTRTGSGTITIGASGETVEVASGVTTNLKNGATLSDNILFDTASKGIYLGVTTATASNLLDDYEEGTWTATFTGSTHTQTGAYTKVGNKVFITVFGRGINVTSSVPARIGGLPFTVKNDSNYYSALTISYNTYATNSDGGNGFFYTNNTNTQLVQVDSTNDASSTIGTGKEIMLSGTYITDA